MDKVKIESILAEEGFRPKIDEDGDLLFKYEGSVYFIEVEDDDEYFIKLVFPNFWELESDEEREAADIVALDTTARVKVAKVFAVENYMWSSAELFLPDEASLAPILSRLLDVVDGAANMFADTMREEYMSDEES